MKAGIFFFFLTSVSLNLSFEVGVLAFISILYMLLMIDELAIGQAPYIGSNFSFFPAIEWSSESQGYIRLKPLLLLLQLFPQLSPTYLLIKRSPISPPTRVKELFHERTGMWGSIVK